MEFIPSWGPISAYCTENVTLLVWFYIRMSAALQAAAHHKVGIGQGWSKPISSRFSTGRRKTREMSLGAWWT
eukprot:583755-Pyramimonas_sp.AAC.1